jgi:putative membrane protein
MPRLYGIAISTIKKEQIWFWQARGPEMMWNWGAGWGWWMMFGWMWMIVLWGLIIWGVYTVVSRLSERREIRAAAEPSALEILERRYANGEISADEFEGMRTRLTGSNVRKVA